MDSRRQKESKEAEQTLSDSEDLKDARGSYLYDNVARQINQSFYSRDDGHFARVKSADCDRGIPTVVVGIRTANRRARMRVRDLWGWHWTDEDYVPSFFNLLFIFYP